MVSYEIKFVEDITVIVTVVRRDKDAGRNRAEDNICSQEGSSERRQREPK